MMKEPELQEKIMQNSSESENSDDDMEEANIEE
jgi:hypothetical protein